MTHELATGMPVPATWSMMVEEELARAWPEPDGSLLGNLADAIRYSLLAPGKRVRPLLAMTAAEACGEDPARAIDVGVAVELMHAYSLVHDDLPCMDDDDVRRGRPTSHKRFNEATAVLVGDALQAAAFGRLVRSEEHRMADDAIVEALAILAGATGWRGMVGGQYIDIAERQDPVDEAQLRDMHDRKTGALIAAAVQLGAVVGGTRGSDLGAWRHFGHELGWLFQLVDDLLDVVGTQDRTGRPAGSDQRLAKVTAAQVYGGVDGLRAAADLQLERCVSLAEALPGDGGRFPDIARFIRHRDH